MLLTMKLRQEIEGLSARLAADILKAFKGASFEDIAELGGSKRGRKANGSSSGKRVRRSIEEIQKSAHAVAKLVGRNADGLRAEEIRTTLDIERKDLPRVLKEALSMKLVRSKGQKRATTYFRN